MHAEKGVSKNDPSNTRRSFFTSSKIRKFVVRHMSGKKHSSQNGNTGMHLLRSSLISVFSTFARFLETEG